MSVLDILLLVPLAWGAYQGFRKGLIFVIIKLLALLVGIYGAIMLGESLSIWLGQNTEWNKEWLPAIGFGLVFIVLVLIVYFFGKIIDTMINALQLKLVNKLAGLALGLVKTVLVLSGFLMVLQSVDKGQLVLTEERKKESILYQPVLDFGSQIIPRIKDSKLFEVVKSNFENAKQQIDLN